MLGAIPRTRGGRKTTEARGPHPACRLGAQLHLSRKSASDIDKAGSRPCRVGCDYLFPLLGVSPGPSSTLPSLATHLLK